VQISGERGRTDGAGALAEGRRHDRDLGTMLGRFDMGAKRELQWTEQQVAERGAQKVDFATLLAESDFITVHCPRNSETLGMFNAEAFARMKPNAFFVNTARGKIHEEGALLEALNARRIAGAGIDVFDVEPPPPDHPLLHLDTVMATPHIAGATVETSYDMTKAAAEQWIDLLRGRVPPRLVNPEIWSRYSDRFEQIIGFRPDPIG